LAPGLRCVFCGINPGRVSDAAAAHFANPRNDFWRLLHDAGFTPRLFDPQEQFSLLDLGIGVTNAAYRTTPGSGDLRRGDFDSAAFEERVRAAAPRAVAFVGKEAYRGLYGERAELGPQLRSIGSTGLFVLPSTSPANAAVPYDERLRWFRALAEWLEPFERQAVRGLVLDTGGRVLLVRFEHPVTHDSWWATTGGGIDPGESDEQALRRELREEAGLEDFEVGPVVYTREHTFPWDGRIIHQREKFHLVRVDQHDAAPTIDVAAEGVTEVRWWPLDELTATHERIVPADLATLVRTLAP
jgi:G:T/U-mismatch repair DNA glycosylase/ADP-ribose pyrophosphatase YjhB (NUDIX family)